MQTVLDEDVGVSDDEDLLRDEEELDETSAEFLHDLIMKLVEFTEVFCSEPAPKDPFKFYPYQVPIAYSVIESFIIGGAAAGEKTLIATRQSGKSEIVANCVAAMMAILPQLSHVYPHWLSKYKNGVLVGVFAPTEEQADTVFGRIVTKLTSDTATDVLFEFDEKTGTKGSRGKGKVIALNKSGSLCRMQSCNPSAKVESKTYHFVFIDEAQEADERMIKKSIQPMLASTNGVMWLGGTAQSYKSYFYNAIQRNKRTDVNGGRGHKQRHWEYDWKIAAKYNENYRLFIKQKITEIGEDADEFRMSYSSTGDTEVLTSDLRYVRLDSLMVGDRLVGFDESSESNGKHRQLQHTMVTDIKRHHLPSYEVTLEDGTVTTSSGDHQWLVQTPGRRTVWKHTDQLHTDDRVWRVLDKWYPHSPSYEVGYLRAAFDGEGSLEVARGIVNGISFSQRDNAMLAEVKKCLAHFGYSYSEYEGGGTNGDVHRLRLDGGRAAIMRFLGEVRPHRLLDRFAELEGSFGSIGQHGKRHSADGFRHPLVDKVRFLGEREVVSIKTATNTYVAEGLASHNCNVWLLEKGMFVTEERLERLYDKSMTRVKQFWRTPVIVGVDPARSNDSTVVTVVWVDWDHPDPFGYYEHRVLDWLEINNVEWESQYFEILDFLKNYNVLRIGVDAQGMGSPVAERLQTLLPSIEVMPIGSDLKAQNERWTHLMQLIQREQLYIPGHSHARRTKQWKKFNQQMTDLERLQKGTAMLAAAPDEKGAFDDYADSLALACFMSTQDTMPEMQVFDSPFFQ
jgi:hypothetical protein